MQEKKNSWPIIRKASKLLVSSITLFSLAQCSSPKTAVTTPENKISKKEMAQIEHAMPNTEALLGKGIDFLAVGTSPSPWRLTLNTEDSLIFSSDEGVRFATKKWKRQETPERGIKISSIVSNNLNLQVTGTNTACDKSRPQMKAVQVQVGSKVYEGCAMFLINKNLQGKWLSTTSVNGKKPYIQFDFSKASIKGFDGCDNFFGSFYEEGTRLNFGEFTYTNKNCKSNIFKEKAYKFVRQKTVPFKLTGNKLELMLIDDSRLVFEKAQ